MLKPTFLAYFVLVFQVMSQFICIYTAFTSRWVLGDSNCNNTCGLTQALTRANFSFSPANVTNIAQNNLSIIESVFLNESDSYKKTCEFAPAILPTIESLFPRQNTTQDETESTTVQPGDESTAIQG